MLYLLRRSIGLLRVVCIKLRLVQAPVRVHVLVNLGLRWVSRIGGGDVGIVATNGGLFLERHRGNLSVSGTNENLSNFLILNRQKCGGGGAFSIPGFAISGFAISGFAISGFAISGFAIPGFAISGFAISGFAISGFAVPGFAISGFAVFPTSTYYHILTERKQSKVVDT